jgi:hypothetical protein
MRATQEGTKMSDLTNKFLYRATQIPKGLEHGMMLCFINLK